MARQAGCELFCFGAEGVAGFGAIDAFQADFCFLAGAEDLNSVAIRNPDAFAGEGLGGERRLAIESRGLQAEKKPCRPPQQMDATSVTGICQKGGAL